MQCEICGSALDEKGRCTVCKKKKKVPRSKGSVFGHSFLLVLATLILVNHLILCATGRVLLNKDVLHKALEGVKFSTVEVVDNEEKMTLAEYIRREYVTDPAVTTGDVEAVLNQMDLEALAIRKLDNYQNYYRGTEDRLETFTPQEIVDILDQNEAMIREKLQVEITQQDKDTLVAELRDPCTAYNEGMVRYYNSGVGRFWNRLQLNLWFMLGELVLLLVILIRWCVLFCSGRGRAAHGIRAFAITVLVPSAVYALAGAFGSFAAKYTFTEFPVLADITSGASAPLLMFGGIGTLASIFMLILAAMILSLTRKPASDAEILSEIPEAAPEFVEAPEQEPVPVAAGVPMGDAPVSEAPAAPVGDAPASEAPAAPVGDAPVSEAPAAPVGDAPVSEAPAAPVGDAPVSEAPAPVGDAPVSEAPAAPVGDAPVSETPAAPVGDAPAPEAPAFCKECGAQILQPGVQRFCIKCGKKLD